MILLHHGLNGYSFIRGHGDADLIDVFFPKFAEKPGMTHDRE